MKFNLQKIARSRKLEYSIFVFILLFLYNIVFPMHDVLVLFIIHEMLVFAAAFILFEYLKDFFTSRMVQPISLVLNIGIFAAVISLVASITKFTLSSNNINIETRNFISALFSILAIFILIGIVIFIFSSLRELFFLRQKKDPSVYMNTMLVFFMFTFFSNIFVKINPEYDFIKESFYVVSIILISLNSLRVSWIGFLPKKQKVYLILISVVLILVFSFNFGMISGDDSFETIVVSFSPGLLTLINLIMLYGIIFSTVLFFTTLFHLPTAEAFDRKREEVSSLIDLTKLITQVFDFKELAESVTLLTSKICNSDASWLVIKQGDEFELKSVNNIGYLEADELTKFILGQKYDMDEGVTIVTRHNLAPFVKNSNSQFNFDSIAFSCLMHHEDISGYLFAARSLEIKYDDDDRKAISAFANYAAVALENAKLIEESIEKERMEKELDVAREIQRKILPHQVPELDEYQFSALFIPAFEVGGDYYDFFKLDEENYAVVVADVSGKGISAAFIMAEVKGIFGSLSKIFSNPKELLVRVNDVLKDTLDRKTFVTSIYYVINIKTGKLSFARSGHTPALLCSNGVIQKIQPPGIGLGLDYGISFENSLKEMEISLNYNDILVLYSDGIPESKNSNFEDFGYERIEKIVSDSCHLSASEISNKIMTELTTFSLDNSQHDDITLVILKRLNNNK